MGTDGRMMLDFAELAAVIRRIKGPISDLLGPFGVCCLKAALWKVVWRVGLVYWGKGPPFSWGQ